MKNLNCKIEKFQRSKEKQKIICLFFSRLTEKEVNYCGGIIHFTVMDHDLMWSNDFEGEAFLEITKLPGVPHETVHDNRPFDELKQIELSLTHPKSKTKRENFIFIHSIESTKSILFFFFSHSKSNHRNFRTTNQ